MILKQLPNLETIVLHRWLPRGERVEGEMELETGVSRYQLLLMEWINNKVLLYSTQNYIQYPMINQKEKNFFNVHTCITELLCCTAEISTTL